MTPSKSPVSRSDPAAACAYASDEWHATGGLNAFNALGGIASDSRRYVHAHPRIKAPNAVISTKGDAGIELIKFLKAAARRVLVEQESVLLDPRDTASFNASGTILLYAELDRVISLATMHKPVTIRQPLRRKSREVLKQIGIFH